ncbi:MAG: hypothetical protein M3Q64_01085, partial [bacterium]|nr:hypothetical protein [bacterium]
MGRETTAHQGLKKVNIDSLLKEAGIVVNKKRGEVHYHVISSNDDMIEVITKSKDVSLYLSQLQGKNAYDIVSAIRNRAKACGNRILLERYNNAVIVTRVDGDDR